MKDEESKSMVLNHIYISNWILASLRVNAGSSKGLFWKEEQTSFYFDRQSCWWDVVASRGKPALTSTFISVFHLYHLLILLKIIFSSIRASLYFMILHPNSSDSHWVPLRIRVGGRTRVTGSFWVRVLMTSVLRSPAPSHAASIDLLLIVVNASAFAVLWNWILIVLLYWQGLGTVRRSIYYCWLKSIIFFYVSALNKFALL